MKASTLLCGGRAAALVVVALASPWLPAAAAVTEAQNCPDPATPAAAARLTALFDDGGNDDPADDLIVAELELCRPVDDRADYRLHLDFAGPPPAGDGCRSAADARVIRGYASGYAGGGHRRIVPALVFEDGGGDGVLDTLVFEVPVDALDPRLPRDGSAVVYLWAEAAFGRYADRIPDTDQSDGCTEPQGEDEVLAVALDAELPPPQVAGVAVPDGQVEMAIEQIDELAEDLLAETGIPGLAVAVVHDGEVAYAEGFGVRKLGEDAPVDADTAFQLASLSKPVGATVVARQVGEGVIDWDTPIVDHLPWFALGDPWVTDHVTVGDMYAHRSGLPAHAGDDLEDLGYGRREVLERLRLLPLFPFRSHYAYTNFGLTAAAEAVAAASGIDWATLSEEAIYDPLGMEATSSRFSDFVAQDNRAHGHALADGRFAPLFQRQPDAQSAAGGVSSTATDMAKWMLMVLQGGTFEGREIVAAEALLPAITPQIVSSPAYASDARAGFYGYGFNVGVQPSGRVTLSHSGAFNLGAATSFVLLPSVQTGIIVLSNAAPIGAVEALAAQFADLVQFGEITRDWVATYAAQFAPITAPVGEFAGKAPPAEPTPPHDLAAYAGTYANEYFGEATVTADGDGLVLAVGPDPQAYAMRHWDGDTFVFTPVGENAPEGSRSAVHFEVTEAGTVTAMTVEFFDENGLGRFERR